MSRLLKRSALLLILVLWASPAAATADVHDWARDHDAARRYLSFGADPLPTAINADARGLPLFPYNGHLRYNPTSIGQWGLNAYSRWKLTRSRAALETAKRAGHWLLAHQRPDGRWLYRFRWGLSGVYIDPPWGSGLAQGSAIALLGRLYRTTHHPRYLRAAKLALASLNQPLNNNGFRATFGRYTWFAEYPIGSGTFELTGMLYTLVGLHDLAPLSPVARRLFRAGLRSVPAMLPLYDAGGGNSYYNLAHVTIGAFPIHEPVQYGNQHVRLLWLLDSWKPNRRIRHYADKWERPEP